MNELAYHIRGADALRPRFREILEGAPYHEDQSPSLICGFSAPSRGREHIICLNTPRSLTNLDIGMGVPDPSGKKDNLRGNFRPIVRKLHLVGLIDRSHFFDLQQ